MRFAGWRLAVGALGVLCATGCRDVTGPGGVSIHGAWVLTLRAEDEKGGSCEANAPIFFEQDDDRFVGQLDGGVTCRAGSSEMMKPVGGSSVLDGRITGSQVSFDLELFNGILAVMLCEMVAPTPAQSNTLTGSATCWGRVGSTSTTMVGEWSARRRT